MNEANAVEEPIRTKIETDTSKQLESLFGLRGRRSQMESISPSQEFMESNKNAAVAAGNKLRTAEFETNKEGAAAKGDADAVRTRAEGDKQAAILQGAPQL